MGELKAVINLEDNFSTQIKSAISSTDSFQQAVLKAKKEIESLSSQRYEATIKAKDEATEQISKTKKALNDFKTNVAIMIAAKDVATESIQRIKGHVRLLVDKPYSLIINAIDKTKSIISSITSSIFNLKTLAAGIVFGAATKKGFDWTMGNAMDNEDFSATLETVLHSKEKGSDALKWAYKDAASTPFDAKQVVEGVTKLATSQLDYTKYLNPLGDAAAAMNKPLDQAIFAMSKLKSGQLGMAVDMFRDFGISNQDWTAHGATFSKNGEMTGVTPDQAVDLVTKIINEKYGGLMERKSGTARGMLSNMGDTIASMGRGLAGIDDNGKMMEGGLFDNFKKQLANIGPLLQQIKDSDAFKNLQTDIGNLATAGGDKLTAFLEGFKDPDKVKEYEDKFKDFVAGVKEGCTTTKEFAKSMIDLMKELKPVIDMVVAHPKLFAGLFIGMEAGKGVFGAIKTVNSIKKELSPLMTAAKTFGKGAKGATTSAGKVPTSAASSFGKSITNGIKGIPKSLSNVTNTFRVWAGTIGAVIKNNIGKAFSSLGKTVASGVKSIPGAFKSVVSGISSVAGSVGRIVGSLGKTILSGLKSIPSGFKSIISVVKTVASVVGPAIGTVAKLIGGTLMTVVRVASAGIVTAIRAVVTAMIANPIGAIITAIVAVCALLYEAWVNDWGGIREKTQVVIDYVKEKIAAVPEVFAKVKEKVLEFVDYLKQKWEDLKNFFAHPIDGAINIAKKIKDSVTGEEDTGKNALGTDYWKGGLTWVGENGPELLDLNKGSKVIPNRQSMNMVNALANNPAQFTTMPHDFSKTGEQIPKSLSKGIQKTSDIAQDTVTKMSQDVLKTFGDGITDNAKYATKSTDDLSTGIQSIFSILGKKSNPLGRNVTDGLGQGIQDSSSNVTDMAKTLTDKVIQTFKEGFDIHSPSRVMHEIGGHVMQGFMNGLSSKDLKAFADKQIKTVTGAFGTAVNVPGGVADWLTQALIATGTPLSWLPGLEKLVMAESGGDPNSVNSQSVGGEYATGLLQTLPSTFKEYMQKGMNNIQNPVDNAAAAINYIKSRYGDVYSTPLFRGGPYAGYESGTTYATPGYHWVGEKGPELMKFNGGEEVINHKDSQKGLGSRAIKVFVKILGNVIGNEEFADEVGERIVDKVVTVLDTNM
ncbi:transglycosylase SLT domain-containing protein [Clostridium beijerinckii]|uniref:transglycosylase SLT domain-containing protein n=1 Tax=Clostridium beijerinckii TaxID=1520 RepID=UPI001361940E|nr:transglycosylase SLT domain-containing protein [Clostridium beijerinckii]MZK51867.1 transglycosylase SLT domain-containing protein [Clostridium beijerinckii]MZK61866.1 transglycosylase SLT domain-containing protein [Clostridium beijerinckii]MZK70294.1 transglycosylase SLT domain-containing protein [Clostridium beijerinckii]MZK77429.1 transglycosylase SLT domain-containing protein [Clostridium beijerinckii]MZK85205.1 transglycosylase SLT domain-containing protein [Clostridium beijerinckii]